MAYVNWDNYKKEVTELHNEGKTSAEIAEQLAHQYEEIRPSLASSIRSAIRRWRKEDSTQIKDKTAKILLFDIETSPLLVWNWGLRQKYTQIEAIKQKSFVICWSAKWLFEDEMIEGCVTSKEAKNQDDERIVKKLWDLLDEADIVVGHNSKKFDEKKMNGRFLKYNLHLPSPYKSIDTYTSARRVFSIESLKLDYIAEYLGLEKKHDTSFELWLECMEGNTKKLKEMQNYCSQDVRVLENVYLKLRPYMKTHPNLGLYIETDTKVCPACGSNDLKDEGVYTTYVSKYKALRCLTCGSLTRSRTNTQTTEERKNIVRSI